MFPLPSSSDHAQFNTTGYLKPIINLDGQHDHHHLLSAADKQQQQPFGKALAIIIFAFIFFRIFSIFFRFHRRHPFPYHHLALLAFLLRQRWSHGADDHSVDRGYDGESKQEGVEAAVMESFPVLRYSDVRKLIRNNMLRETAGCAICLTDYVEGERVLLRLLAKCDHVFHVSCIDRWLTFHVTCPVCRAVLTADSGEHDKVDR